MTLLDKFREFSPERRKALAAKGAAMPDGSFPISTAGDLKNAIKAIGRAKNRAATVKHIQKRARALGKTDLLPEEWKGSAHAEEEMPMRKKRKMPDMKEANMPDKEELTQQEPPVEPAEATPDPRVEKLAAELDAERKAREALEAQLKTERIERRKAELLTRAEGFSYLPMAKDEFVEKMLKLEALDKDLAVYFDEKFAAVAEAMAEAGHLSELGSEASDTKAPVEKFLAIVGEIKDKETSGDQGKAIALASQRHPRLARAYLDSGK